MKRILFIVLALMAIGATALFVTEPPKTPPPPQQQTSTISMNNTTPPSSKEKAIVATIVTKKGEIVLHLYPQVAPKTVENFVKLSKEKFYDGVTFHRVVPGFVIQGGDPLSKDDDPSNDGTGGPGYTFEDEINPAALGISEDEIAQNVARGYRYQNNLPSMAVDVGVIAMANSGPNTNGSQFFIVTETAQLHLNGLHTVFGEVVAGMDIVRKINQGDTIQTILIQQ